MRDLSVFKKFNFERPPVGVKFLLNRPQGIKKLGKKNLAFCEMLGEAHKSPPFYAAEDNFPCMGPSLMGMREFDPIFASGQVGARDKIFQEARANRRLYDYLPKLDKGTVRYVAFAPLDQLTFTPDVFIITAKVEQAEILFRAICYSTGQMITSRIMPVLMCAWLYLYPFVSGQMNYSVSGIGAGMKSRQALPEGLVLISLPYDLLPMVVENLENMDWTLPIYKLPADQRVGHFEKVVDQLNQEYQNG